MSVNGRSLHWWSAEQLQQLSDRVAHVLARWCASWNLPASQAQSVRCVLAHECNAVNAAEQRWIPLLSLAGADRQVWIRIDEAPEEAIYAAMFGERAVRTSPGREAGAVASELSCQAWNDWCHEMRQIFDTGAATGQPAPENAISHDEPPAWHFRPWSGAVTITVAGTSVRFALHLGPACAAHVMPSQSKPAAGKTAGRPAVVALAKALDTQTVHLRVGLADVELEIGNLQALAEGDVIRLPHLLHQPLRVCADDGSVLCAAYLGQVGGRRAVELARLPINHLE
jgi:hypothetical protein